MPPIWIADYEAGRGKRYSALFSQIKRLAKQLPEFSRELDRLVFDVMREMDNCADPNCPACRMTFEEFHARCAENRFLEGALKGEK